MRLHLFTASYPTGFGESFLNNEIPQLEKEFEELRIYPLKKLAKEQTAFNGDHSIVHNDELYEKGPLSLSDHLWILRILLIEFAGITQKSFFIKNIRLFYAMLKKAMLLSKWLKEQKIEKGDACYSFWMNEWALALAILKRRYSTPDFVFRINGYDIYDERHAGNYLPFRHFIYAQTKRVIPLSETSAIYVKQRTAFPNKVMPSYFGTKDFGLAQKTEREKFVLFTCSSAIPLKRLDKIARVVSLLKFPTLWVHHGDGPTMEQVSQIMNNSPEHIEFRHSKKVENYFEVLEMHKELAPDLFINLSTTEGFPITLMEAQSFGTPILVNDVGSCAEFIKPFTGLMVGVNETPEEISEKIAKFNDSRDTEFPRKKIRTFWEENFSAEKNYTKFAQEIKQIFNGIKR